MTELLLLLFLIVRNPSGITFAQGIDPNLLKRLVRYGGVGLILNLSMLALTFSDRYVIMFYDGLEAVGKYDQVYKISQLSVVALTTVFFNTINPKLLKALEQGKERSLPLSGSYMKIFLLWGMPVVTYLSIYAHEISNLLLGAEFRSAYVLMPYIFWGTFLIGLANFYELHLKFDNRFRKLIILSLTTALSNLLLNMIFISVFNFHWAAYTTLFSYALFLVLAHRMEPQLSMAMSGSGRWLLKSLIILAGQSALYFVVVDNYEPGIIYRIVLGLIFVLLYVFLMRKELFSALLKTEKA